MNAVYDCMDPKLPMLADVTVERLGEVFDMSKTGQYDLKEFVQAVQKVQAVCPEVIDSYQVLATTLAGLQEYQNSTVVIDGLKRAGSYVEFEYPWGVKRIFMLGGYLRSGDNLRVTQAQLIELITAPTLKELRVHDCIHTHGSCIFIYKDAQAEGRFV